MLEVTAGIYCKEVPLSVTWLKICFVGRGLNRCCRFFGLFLNWGGIWLRGCGVAGRREGLLKNISVPTYHSHSDESCHHWERYEITVKVRKEYFPDYLAFDQQELAHIPA
ncbi:MAG: hypothetical protein AB4352_08030 [Hormoscilla sp.]